jgi:hypothetical protein
VNIPISKAGIKDSGVTRVTAGDKIAKSGPGAPLYAQTDVKAAVDAVAAETTTLKGRISDFNYAKATFANATTALAGSIEDWDKSFDVLVAVGEKVFTSENDATSIALVPATPTKHVLAMPLAIEMKQDLKRGLVRIHVVRAPGMTSHSTQVSPDPTNPALWKELDGDSVNHTIVNPTPGNLWARASARTGTGTSAYTAPVLLVVK